jgi:hypothetical protein
MSLRSQADVHPLCPVHYVPMNTTESVDAGTTYACGEHGCHFHWKWDSGYFCIEGGRVAYPTNVHQILKLAPIREHGYMYIAAVEGPPRQRTWRCAMKDCQNVIVDDAPPN